jgi:thiol:disulfide interchange protein
VTTLPTWPIAGGSLVLGFAVADVTGVRALGGIVLLVAVAWLGTVWRRRAGLPRAVALGALYLAAFVASHVVADALGTWGAVLSVAALVAATSWAVSDRAEPSVRREAFPPPQAPH